MVVSACCVSCMDEDEVVIFNCAKVDCMCQLCASCVREAFNDDSGANSKFCLMCGTPSALDMIKSVCGQGAIKAVEEGVRADPEFKVREEAAKKDASRKDATKTRDCARQMFNDLADEINLKCPHCKMPFADYDGCNALTCANVDCRAGFCAVCLQDCQHDAHAHVRNAHGAGALFDKSAFERNRVRRAKAILERKMDELSSEPFELKQLVRNHVEKAQLMQVSDSAPQNNGKTAASKSAASYSKRPPFLLSAPEECNQRNNITRDDVSPRCVIPKACRLALVNTNGDVCRMSLECNMIEGEDLWEHLTVKDVESHFKNNPKVDSLLNLKQALQCAVIAFDGHSSIHQTSRARPPKNHDLAADEVCIAFNAASRDGTIREEACVPCERLIVVGLNQNKRMTLLEKHATSASESALMFAPLKHLIGVGNPTSVITGLQMALPESHAELNEQQRKVGHPLCLRTAQEVAGPPGTGKTKTIAELVRALLICTDLDILLLSERNRAINAVAEKFQKASLKMTRNKNVEITDLSVWFSAMTHGAGDAMGECTKLFTLEEKLRCHPQLVVLQNKREMLVQASTSLAAGMRRKLAETIRRFGEKFSDNEAIFRSNQILKDAGGELSSPLSIISIIQSASSEIEDALSSTSSRGKKYLPEEDVEELVTRHSVLIAKLICIRSPEEKKKDKAGNAWDAKGATRRLLNITRRFREVGQDKLFQEEHARSLHEERRTVDEQHRALKMRLEMELPKLARLHMSAIGSSHKLPGDLNDTDSSLLRQFGELALEDSESNDEAELALSKKTVVIFDESGCIPAYELLGLTRLGRSIESLVLVGDKHQLPPCDAVQGRGFRSRTRTPERQHREHLGSLLDASTLTLDAGKVALTTQHRAPKDVADMLNVRVCGGNCNTSPKADVPLSGLQMVNVPKDRNPRKKHVDSNEVNEALHLIDKLGLNFQTSAILICKNQQREFEFQLKRASLEGVASVLTIDQCQGQEADAVILSLVQRPTRFLTKNRLNVALLRVRKKLCVLVDFDELRDACRDCHWEAAQMAADLLLMQDMTMSAETEPSGAGQKVLVPESDLM